MSFASPSLTELGVVLAAVAEVVFQLTILALIVAKGRTTPAVRLAWLIVVAVLPILGGLLYLRLGRMPARAKAADQQRLLAAVRERARADSLGSRVVPPAESAGLRKGVHLLEALGGLPACAGNRLRLFGRARVTDDSSQAIDRLVDDIAGARSSCNLLFYIYLDDATGRRVAEAMLTAAVRGVVCRLLVDAVGSGEFLDSRLCRRLSDGGVEVARALPVTAVRALFGRFDYRNHRKLAVIDGLIGWTGSRNIANPSFAPKARYAPWVDVMVRLEGPAVHDLQRVFAEDWLLESGGSIEDLLTPRPQPLEDGVVAQILPSGPNAAGQRAMTEATLLGFLEADRELILTTPYFVPDDATLTAICATARSGVRTMLVVPQRNDSRTVSAASRSYYDSLLEAGVEIYEYPHGLLHAKTATIDGALSVVATANLDRRSYELNYEISLMVASRRFTAQLRELQIGYAESSVIVDAMRWTKRPLRRRLVENAAGLLSPLL